MYHCQLCYLEGNPQFDSEDDLLWKKDEMSTLEKTVCVSIVTLYSPA